MDIEARRTPMVHGKVSLWYKTSFDVAHRTIKTYMQALIQQCLFSYRRRNIWFLVTVTVCIGPQFSSSGRPKCKQYKVKVYFLQKIDA
jgi:hypothetical protein